MSKEWVVILYKLVETWPRPGGTFKFLAAVHFFSFFIASIDCGLELLLLYYFHREHRGLGVWKLLFLLLLLLLLLFWRHFAKRIELAIVVCLEALDGQFSAKTVVKSVPNTACNTKKACSKSLSERYRMLSHSLDRACCCCWFCCCCYCCCCRWRSLNVKYTN